MSYLYDKYQDLGRTIRDAKAERDDIKDKEILPAMLDGEVFGDDKNCLVIELSDSFTFDYKKARRDGKIDDDTWKEYGKVDIIAKLVARKRDMTEREIERQKNLRLAASDDLLRNLEELVSFTETYMTEEGKSIGGGVAIAGAIAAIEKAKSGGIS